MMRTKRLFCISSVENQRRCPDQNSLSTQVRKRETTQLFHFAAAANDNPRSPTRRGNKKGTWAKKIIHHRINKQVVPGLEPGIRERVFDMNQNPTLFLALESESM
jgi:hypothetical protein